MQNLCFHQTALIETVHILITIHLLLYVSAETSDYSFIWMCMTYEESYFKVIWYIIVELERKKKKHFLMEKGCSYYDVLLIVIKSIEFVKMKIVLYNFWGENVKIRLF